MEDKMEAQLLQVKRRVGMHFEVLPCNVAIYTLFHETMDNEEECVGYAGLLEEFPRLLDELWYGGLREYAQIDDEHRAAIVAKLRQLADALETREHEGPLSVV
jgi:hypothetical protein